MTIGVDLGGTNIRAGVREGNEIIKRVETSLLDKHSLEGTLDQLIQLIRPLISGSIKGIGVAVPSIVDAENGIVSNVVNIPSWQRVALKSILEREFRLPVGVQNDANCFVLGEYRYGKAKGFSRVVGITLGTGVGSGLILDGRMYSGKNGGAGEVGYLQYLDRDFEFYGGSFFFDRMHHTTARSEFEKAGSGDKQSLKIWEEYGIHIGNLVKAVVYVYDPEVIVFGGSIAKAWDFFEGSMRKTLSKGFHFPGSVQKLEMYRSENEHVTLLGAGSLVKDDDDR